MKKKVVKEEPKRYDMVGNELHLNDIVAIARGKDYMLMGRISHFTNKGAKVMVPDNDYYLYMKPNVLATRLMVNILSNTLSRKSIYNPVTNEPMKDTFIYYSGVSSKFSITHPISGSDVYQATYGNMIKVDKFKNN